ncbi:MAG: Rrf2 family transcriptional regulator [Thermodesulfobacteriota bacterium]|jgi:Rrf2 family protein
MKLSLKSEYAFLALYELSANYGKGLLKVENIASKYEMPAKFLEQILLQLKWAGIVKSKRGSNGGYALSKVPEKTKLADVIRLLDGPLASVSSVSIYFYERSPIEKIPKLKDMLLDIRNYTARKLENFTLKDLLQ